MNKFIIVLLVAVAAGSCVAQAPAPISAQDLAFDMYNTCLKDFNVRCVKPKAMQWFNQALTQDEILITDQLSVVRTGRAPVEEKRSNNAQEQLFDDIDSYLATHSLRIKAPAYFRTAEARSFVPEFLLNNALTNGAIVPLADRSATQGRGIIRKAVLPFLLGLKLKTTVLVPLALGLIALKTWKAMTLGLLSLVLSGALVIFKIAKPKIVNYEVVHYPPPHVEHIEHIPHHHVEHIEHIPHHHVEHIVPHHLEHHVEHHHLDLPHHVEHHVEHLEHPAPAWDPHAWSRSSHEPQDAQDMAYAGQNRR